MSLLVVAIGGTTPIGAPVVGWVAGELGTQAAFGLVGTGTVLAAAAVAAYLRRALRDGPEPVVRARLG